MTDMADYIQAVVQDKPVAALKAFSDAMEPKIQAAMDAKYNEVAQTVFNPPFNDTQGVVGEIENADLETEMDEQEDV